MKKIILFLGLACCSNGLFAQNTFPPTGFAGIGTAVPISQLQVVGVTTSTVVALSDGTNLAGYLGRGANISSGYSATPEVLSLSYMKRDFAIGGWGKTDLAFHGISFYINSDNGYVGIGTIAPQEALSVNGNIRSKQVKVETVNWPDYVFDDHYQVMPLPDLEKYITKNRHLPEMPSAIEVASNGQNLGEINLKLLKNLEELTLHLIEKDKQIQKQQNQLNLQQQDINQIKTQLKALKNQ